MGAHNRERLFLISLSICFLSLSFAYQLAIPVGEAPDEISHFRVITYLIQHKSWPIVRGQDPHVPHESTQFPLYYFTSALAASWVDLDEQPFKEQPNPHHIGAPAPPPEGWANRNFIVHDPKEIWNWRGEFLAWRIARFVSTIAGLAGVLLTYRLIRRILPRQRKAAMVAAALMALHPRWIALASSVSNDALAVAGAALALNTIADYALYPSWGAAWKVGLALGVAILSKASNIGLLLVWLIVGILSTRTQLPRAGLAWIPAMAFSLIGISLLSGGWLLWNFLHYRDPLALRPHIEIISWRRPAPPIWSDWIFIFLRARETAVLSFGATEGILGDRWVYTITDLLIAATAWQGLRKLWRLRLCWGEDRTRALLILAHVFWLLIILLSFIAWNIRVDALSGRLLFVGLPALWLLVAWAWEGSREGKLVLHAWLGWMAVLAILGFARYLWPAFHQPLYTMTEIPYRIERLDWVFNDLEEPQNPLIRLIGVQVEPRRLSPGQPIRLIACWQLLRPAHRNYSFTYQIWAGLEPSGERLGQRDSYPGMGAWPMRFWPPGLVICDRHQIVLSSPSESPIVLTLLVGVYDRARSDLPQLPRQNGSGWIPVAKIRAPSGQSPPKTWEAHFSPGIFLLAHEARPARQGISVRLVWQATSSLPSGLHVFLHLLDEEGRWIAGGDGPPRHGKYPTEWWEPGEIVEEERWIPLRRPLPPGIYSLHVGWYYLETGERLPAFDRLDKPIPSNSVKLGEIIINQETQN